MNNVKTVNPVAAAMVIVFSVAAALCLCMTPFFMSQSRHLTIRDAGTGELIAKYRVREGENFSIGFVHSVNKSPLTDYYTVKADGLYVEKTVYYGFGAGVETELLPGEVLRYGKDHSMIVSGFDKRIDPLTYFVGTVSDHILKIGGDDMPAISLRELCGRNRRVRFSLEQYRFFS